MKTFMGAAICLAIGAAGLGGCDAHPKGSDRAAGASQAVSASMPTNIALTSKGAPRRADGYWEMASFTDSGVQMSKQYLCVGADSETAYSVFDQLAAVGDCSKRDFTRTASGWAFETRCRLMDTETVQKGTINGDFRQGFRVDQTVTQGPASEIKGSIRGKRMGECPAKFKPGDLVDQGGDKLGNLLPH